MQRYDIAILGTGPAGLEAALTAKIRNKTVLLLGNAQLSGKVRKAHTVQNYLGLPGISGEEMQRAFLAHLAALDLTITDDRATAVYAMGDYFAVQGRQELYEATAVILACGAASAKPLPGEQENLGRGVSYCATCDAMLYKNKTAIVVGYTQEEEREAAFLAEVAQEVFYLPMYPDAGPAGARVTVLPGKKPTAIERDGQQMRLVLEDGALTADGVFLLRESVAPAQLVPGLAPDGAHVAVDRQMKTNLAGLFACGDMTGTPYQYAKAAGEGNVAALSAVAYLAEVKRNNA